MKINQLKSHLKKIFPHIYPSLHELSYRGKKANFVIKGHFANRRKKIPLHFLHIGKTGGTTLKHVLSEQCNCSDYLIFLHNHNIRLQDIPRGHRVFFFIRDPIDRFVSGFNSRKRQGKPRYRQPWSSQEKKAFNIFESPNSLAISLYSNDDYLRESACKGMAEIQHVRDKYSYWFSSIDYVQKREKDIIFCGIHEDFLSSFEGLKSILNLPKDLDLPTSEILTHRAPEADDRILSTLARENLKVWYAEDYKYYNYFKDFHRDCINNLHS